MLSGDQGGPLLESFRSPFLGLLHKDLLEFVGISGGEGVRRPIEVVSRIHPAGEVGHSGLGVALHLYVGAFKSLIDRIFAFADTVDGMDRIHQYSGDSLDRVALLKLLGRDLGHEFPVGPLAKFLLLEVGSHELVEWFKRDLRELRLCRLIEAFTDLLARKPADLVSSDLGAIDVIAP